MADTIIATQNNESGFSLLEILVVLAIMSVLLSVGGSYTMGYVNAVKFSQTSHEAVSDIISYRHEAYIQGKTFIVVQDSEDEEQIRGVEFAEWNIPKGWQVSGDRIEITERGFCLGGIVSFEDPDGRDATFEIKAPFCERSQIETIDQE